VPGRALRVNHADRPPPKTHQAGASPVANAPTAGRAGL